MVCGVNEAVVIGGGVSGVTNALLLARFGWRVTLVEAAPRLLPLLRGFSRGKVRFDTGFHYAGGLDRGQELWRLFALLDIERQVQSLPMRAAGFDRIVNAAAAFQLDLPSGAEAFTAALIERFPRQRHAIKRYVSDLLAAGARLPYVNPAADTPLDFSLDRDEISLGEYLAAVSDDADLRRVLSLHCVLHGNAAAQVPFAYHAAVVAPYIRCASTIKGGGAALAKALTQALERADVCCRCGVAVQGLKLSAAGRVAGVELDSGEVLHCGTVINSTSPANLDAWLPAGALRPVYRRRLRSLPQTTAALLAFVTYRRADDLLCGRNIYIMTEAAELSAYPLDDNVLYLSAASSGSSDGLVAIMPTAETFAAGRTAAYYAAKERHRHKFMQRLSRAVPRLADNIATCELATPLTMRDYARNGSGALYGCGHRVGNFPLHAATRVTGLFNSGQALVACGVMGAMASACVTTGTIIGHQQLLQELYKCS